MAAPIDLPIQNLYTKNSALKILTSNYKIYYVKLVSFLHKNQQGINKAFLPFKQHVTEMQYHL